MRRAHGQAQSCNVNCMVAILQRLWGRRWIAYTLIVVAAVVMTVSGAEPLTLALAAAVLGVVVVDGVRGWRSGARASVEDDQTRRWRAIAYDASGLEGRLARITVEHPCSSSLFDSDLPPGTREVVIVDDTTSVFLDLAVHPVGDSSRRALVRYDQLEIDVADGFTRVGDAGLTPSEYDDWTRSVRYR